PGFAPFCLFLCRFGRTGGLSWCLPFDRCENGCSAPHLSNLAHRGTVMAMSEAKKKELKGRRAAPLVTPSDLGPKASADIAGGMNAILADVWALYFKTKNFHWHMSGPH